MPNPQQAARQIDIEATRGMAILLVVYAHALQIFSPHGAVPNDAAYVQWQFLASCGMPMFFFVSGLVYRVKSHRKAFIATLTLLFVAYACHVTGWLLSSLQAGHFSLAALALPLIKHNGLVPVAVWFLVSITFVQLVFHFAERAAARQRLLIIATVVGLFVAGKLSGRNPFYIGSWAPGLLFLASGHALAHSGWLDKRIRNPVLGWLGVAALMTALAFLAPLNQGCLLDPTSACPHENGRFSVSVMDGNVGFLPAFLLSAVVGICAFWLLSQQLTRHAWIAARLSRLGRHSLALFTLNAFVLSYVQPVLEPALPHVVPMWLLFGLPLVLGGVQLALLRWWRPLNDALLRSAGRLAKATVDRLHPAPSRARAAYQSKPVDLASARGSSLD